jgi:ABC-type branched-subunit amino acid transport system ATPase component
VLSLSDPVIVLSRGAVIAAGPPGVVSADPGVREAYLGEDYVPDPAISGGTTT